MWGKSLDALGEFTSRPNPYAKSVGECAVRATPLLLVFLTGISVSAETWRDIVVAPEHRCSPYEADDYSYPQSLEARIVSGLGGKVYGPYTGRCFSSPQDSDIEHIVARSEAHDSGLCAADAETRRRFARDPLNLTLANPRVNRYEKRGKDAAEWLPNVNECWFAARIVEVRRKYGLTIDRRESGALERVLSACPSTEMVIGDCAASEPQARKTTPLRSVDALGLWDDNGNGRITCAEARRHGIAPVQHDHPAYPFMRDADGDGMVCE